MKYSLSGLIKDLLSRVWHLENDHISASRLSGTVSVDNLPDRSKNKILVVTNDTARFKLTSVTVSEGDIIKVLDTKSTYVVSDISNLNNNNGYTELTVKNAAVANTIANNGTGNMTFHWSGQSGQPTWLFGSNDGVNTYVWNPSNFNVNYAGSAGNADTVDGWHRDDIRAWGNITGKPSTFTPSSHTHSWGQVSGAPATATRWPSWGEVSSKPSNVIRVKSWDATNGILTLESV